MLLLFCYYYHKYFFINLNILNIDVFSPAGNQHHETTYYNYFIIIDLKTRNKKKKFYIMQIAFGKVRNLNDNVREFP